GAPRATLLPYTALFRSSRASVWYAARSVPSILCLPAGDPADQEGDQDDGPVHDRLPEARDALEGEQVLDQADDEDAGERAEDGALAAVHADAADDGRREDHEDPVDAHAGADGTEPPGLQDARQRGERAAEDEHAPQHPVHPDAGGAGRVDVAADRGQGPADPQVGEPGDAR